MGRPHRHRTGGLVVGWLLATPVIFGGLVWGAVHLLATTHPRPVVEECRGEVDGVVMTLATDQADNAALIAATTVRRGLPARAATIALATAIQESTLRNLDYGDRDSLGLFQQRPSQGWGTEAQVLDPVYATGIFLDRLVEVPGWESMDVGDAAQTVQRSAYPDAYDDHEAGARVWASGLTGWSAEAITCTLADPSVPGSTDAMAARVLRDLGELSVAASGNQVDIDPASLGGEQGRAAWAVAQWAVAVAADQKVTSVQVGDRLWTRAGTWQTAESSAPAGVVRVTLAQA